MWKLISRRTVLQQFSKTPQPSTNLEYLPIISIPLKVTIVPYTPQNANSPHYDAAFRYCNDYKSLVSTSRAMFISFSCNYLGHSSRAPHEASHLLQKRLPSLHLHKQWTTKTYFTSDKGKWGNYFYIILHGFLPHICMTVASFQTTQLKWFRLKCWSNINSYLQFYRTHRLCLLKLLDKLYPRCTSYVDDMMEGRHFLG